MLRDACVALNVVMHAHLPPPSSSTSPRLTIVPVAPLSAAFLASAPSCACFCRKCALISFARAICVGKGGLSIGMLFQKIGRSGEEVGSVEVGVELARTDKEG